MSILGFVIFPTGEPFTRQILTWIYESCVVVDIIRCRTTTKEEFREKFKYMYQKIAPSKMAKAEAKIAAQGDATSFLFVIVKGDKGNNKPLKEKIRKFVGCNCIHSADNPNSTMEHIEWLLGKRLIDKIDFNGRKKVDLKTVFDFLYWDFRECGDKLHDGSFKTLGNVFIRMDNYDLKYAVVNMGPTVNDNVYTHNKDIEIVSSERTRIVDTLGATFYYKPGMKKPHESTYLVDVVGRRVKLDFSLSVFIPRRWRDYILATRVIGDEKFYVPLDRDRYWLTMFERVLYKPRKFKPSVQHKYGLGAKWKDLVLWGINMGLHDQVRGYSTLGDCQKALKRYMDSF